MIAASRKPFPAFFWNESATKIPTDNPSGLSYGCYYGFKKKKKKTS